jgi:Tol biopolymer transport system component
MHASSRVSRQSRSARPAWLLGALAVLLLASLSLAQAEPGDTTVIASPGAAYPQMSTDGRYVLFGSYRDLLPENGLGANLFVFDRSTGLFESINDKDSGHSLNGWNWLPQAAMSGDGRYVIWCSYFRVLVRDRVAGTVTPLMIRDRPYRTRECAFAFNEDGRFLAFESSDPWLVPGDTNGQRDMFVLDRSTNSIERVSVSSSGAEADGPAVGLPMLNADGRFAVFASHATNLVPGDTNDEADLFVRDRATGVTTRVNVDAQGAQTDYGVYYFHLFPNGRTISADGRFVTFASYASTLVPGDPQGSEPRTHAYVVDRDTGTVERVSVNTEGQPGDSDSYQPSISGDGRFVSFSSLATNLVPGDYGADTDVFVRDRSVGRTERASVWSSGAESTNLTRGQSYSWGGSLSGDGSVVAFYSVADLAEGVSPYGLNVYLHETGGTDYWVFSVTPSKADFGEQSVGGSSAPMLFTVTNGSTQPLPILTLELRLPDKEHFRETNDCPAALPVGASCTIAVTFTPKTLGPKYATLKVFFDTGAGGTHPVRTLRLSGRGMP